MTAQTQLDERLQCCAERNKILGNNDITKRRKLLEVSLHVITSLSQTHSTEPN